MIQISENIRLREVVKDEYSLALPLYQEKEILWYSENRTEPYTIDDIHRMYDYLNNVGELYYIEYFNESWQVIGDVTLSKQTMPMVISSKYRDLGIGYQVISKLLDRAKNIGLESISLSGIYLYNERSQYFYKKCGFKEIKRDEHKVYMSWRKDETT